MPEEAEPDYLYLTTVGRRSGKPHQIEIWFVQHEGCYYLINEGGQSDWVRNLRQHPGVSFRLGSREAGLIDGTARPVDPAQEPELAAAVRAKMEAKYDWSDGLMVELKPITIRR